MARVKVKDFISLDIPDDMEYSDNLDRYLFSAIRMGEFAEEMLSLDLEVGLEEPFTADRCFILHSSDVRPLNIDNGLDFSDPGVKSDVKCLMNVDGAGDKLLGLERDVTSKLLVERNDLLVAYEYYDDEADDNEPTNMHFIISIATLDTYCSGQIWLNDIETKSGRVKEAERWLNTIEPV